MIEARSQHPAVLDQLRKELLSLKSGPLPAWPRIGRFLDDAESWRYWETEGASSFTEWVRSLARSLGRKERILWRYLAAQRYYKRLRAQLTLGPLGERKLDAPTELPDVASPENLELLSKIARVAPEEVLEPLARRVLRGEISRPELNRAWQAFRPALGGRTARGRGAVKPRIDRKDPDQYEGQRKAMVCHWLQTGPSWTGCKKPVAYEVFLEVRPKPVPDQAFSRVFDAVAVVVRQEGSVELHGVGVKGMFSNDAAPRALSHAARYCDYFWVARSEEAGPVDVSQIPAGIGLLLDRGGRLEVKRRPTRSSESGRSRENLLAGVLARALGR